MADTIRKAYFPNLDGLRCISSLAILLIHVEGIKAKQGQELVNSIFYFKSIGEPLVTMFFALSGFLITYLLLREKENTSTINLKSFYIGRTLRIWPLYFLIGFIGFFIFPLLDTYLHTDYSAGIMEHRWRNLIIYCLFIPLTVPTDTIGASWTVRVEEAFYMIWPIVLKYFKNHIKLLVGIIVVAVIGQNMLIVLARLSESHLLKIIAREAVNYRVNCMAMGGIGAYLYIKEKKEILAILYRKDLQWIAYAITAAMLVFKIHIPFIYFDMYSVLFAFIILNLATNPNSVIRLDYKWLNYLGKISYGIYMYNSLTRILCLEFICRAFGKPISGWQMEVILYAAVIVSTILIATLSYEFFEKPLLRLKKRA